MEEKLVKKRKLYFGFIIVLLLSGISVFGVYKILKVKIEHAETIKLNDAIKQVLPNYDHTEGRVVYYKEGVEEVRVYNAHDKNNRYIGAAVESTSHNVYFGYIDILVGFNNKGVIQNYVVLKQNETPGLGAKVEYWFKSPIGHRSIVNIDMSKCELGLIKDGCTIDAITGATVTSRAFMFAVKNAYYAYVYQNDSMVVNKNGLSGR